MPPVYRPMTVADIDATTYIRKAALDELARSEGHEPEPWTPRRYPHFEHLLRTDPDGSWIAELDGTAVGYAMGFTRGPIWFLAQLFVRPEVHAQGMGAMLLTRSMDAGQARDASVFSVVSSTSPLAQALYMRAGMFATAVCYRMHGPLAALTTQPRTSARVVHADDRWAERLAALDRHAFGAERTLDHRLYLDASAWPEIEHLAFGIERDGALAAYGYVDEDGHIGPLAAFEPDDLRPLLRIAGDWLSARGVESAYGFFPSNNPTMLAAVLSASWRIQHWTFLKTTAPFGRFDCYLPSGGLLL